jgi:hypothetical protein
MWEMNNGFVNWTPAHKARSAIRMAVRTLP